MMTSTKLLILVLSLTIVYGEDLKLKFFEKNNFYEEKIKIDKTTVKYEVPKHGNLEESEYLLDYDSKLVVIKRVASRKCYVYDMPNDMYRPEEVESGVLKFGSKFPGDKYNINNEFILPLEYLNVTNLPPKIQDFCLRYTVQRVEKYNSNAEMEANAYKSLMVPSGGRQKRSYRDYACSPQAAMRAKRCRESRPPKIPTGQRCQYKSSGCLYEVTCERTGQMQFYCPEPPRHRYNWILACCDYTCD